MAMLLNLEVTSIFELLGHDGSKIVAPELPEPDCRIGFRLEEMQFIASKFNFYLSRCIQEWDFKAGNKLLYQSVPEDDWLKNIMSKHIGLLCGVVKGKYHTVAWDTKLIFDPAGWKYEVSNFQIHEFYALRM